MSEWLKEHAWKACVGETLPWVRIPLSPPSKAANTRDIRPDLPVLRLSNRRGYVFASAKQRAKERDLRFDGDVDRRARLPCWCEVQRCVTTCSLWDEHAESRASNSRASDPSRDRTHSCYWSPASTRGCAR